jgi:hypothetical protein
MTNEEHALILKWVPCYIFLSTDEGHDHKTTLVQNQCPVKITCMCCIEIVEVTQVATSDDVFVLTETLISISVDYFKNHRTQVEMRHMPRVQLCLKMGVINQYTYLLEVRGNCSRASAFIKTFLKYYHTCLDEQGR